MSAGAVAAGAVSGDRRATELADRAFPALALVLSLPVGCALALALSRFPVGLPFAVLGAGALLAVVALALVRYDATVALGLVLLGVAATEPAPPDAVFLVAMAVAAVTGRFVAGVATRPVVAILALFAALCLVSTAEVVDVERAALYFAITVYLGVLGLWLSGYVDSHRRAALVVRAYVAAAVCSALVGLLALRGWIPGADLFATGGRARALFQDPNVFGPFLVPAALLVMEEIMRPHVLRARTVTKVLMLVALVLGVLFSYSRGAWLNLAIGLFVIGTVIVLRGATRQILTLVVATLVAAAVVPAAVAATGSADFLAERAKPQAYDTQRFSGQRAGVRAAETHPFGAGPGQFESMAGVAAHSTYARALGEQGYPGLLVVLGLLGLTLVAAARNAARRWTTYGIGTAALLGAWCGLLVNSAFIDTLHWRHLWLLAALIWVVPAARVAASRDVRR